MEKHSALDTWTALEEFAMDQEIEEALAMTDEECDARLRAAGFDIDALHAKADALAPAPAPSGSVAVLRPKRRPLGVAIPATLALAASMALVFATGQSQQVRITPEPVGAPAPSASDLREKARVACEAREWERCVGYLDIAREIDPKGDGTPEVQAMRRAATEK